MNILSLKCKATLTAVIFLLPFLSGASLQADENKENYIGNDRPGEELANMSLPGPKLLEEAEELEKRGSPAQATSKYQAWLDQNQESSDFYKVLLHVLSVQENIRDALGLLQIYSPFVVNPEEHNKLIKHQAGLLEIAGRISDAAALYQSASGSDSQELQLNISLLMFEQGLFEKAEEKLIGVLKSAPGLEPELQARARLLLAQIYEATSRMGEAEVVYLGLLQSFPGGGPLPAALLSYFEFLLAREEKSEAEQILENLKARFPQSPEYSLALGAWENDEDSRISYAPSPPRILSPLSRELTSPLKPAAGGGQRTGSEQAVGEPAASEGAEEKVLVQTGSYRVLENAEYMVLDLKGIGFNASITEASFQEKKFYRVVIDPGKSYEQAQTVLILLKEAGFEGILLFPDKL